MRTEAKAIPPKISAPSSAGKIAGIVLATAAVGVCVLVFFFNPSTHSFYPTCVFHSLTGWYCPTCGMTRALHALLHGNVLAALKDNALFVGLLAMLAVWSGRFAVQKWQGRPVTFQFSPFFFWMLLTIAVFFGVVRNLPGGEWLAP